MAYILVLMPLLLFAEAKDDELDYLFDSKFPISDYIWHTQKENQNILSKSDIFNQNQTKRKLKMLTDENGNPILDEFGNPIYVDENGNMYSKDGVPLDKKVLFNKNGNPVFDKNGNLIIYDKNGRIKDSEDSILLDTFGNPLFDKNGNPLFIDKNGYLKNLKGESIVDSNGKSININNKEALNNFLNQHTQNSIDEQLQKQLAQLEKEAQIQKELRERLLEEEIRRRADPAYQALLAEQEAKKAQRIAAQKEKEFYKSAILGERVGGNSQVFAHKTHAMVMRDFLTKKVLT